MHSSSRVPALVPVLAVAVAALACSNPDADSADAGDESAAAADEGAQSGEVARVTITAPAEGDTLAAGPVRVEMTVTGVAIVPSGDTTTGTGHHHLYLDAELTDASVPIPTVPGSIIHMGDASSEYTFEDVGPGEHILIAVVADGIHVPLQPWVVDTVRFVVR